MHERLKLYFEENNITQQQIADSLGVSLQYINQLLNGHKVLGKKNAERLANLYGLSKLFLLTGEGPITNPSANTTQVPAIDHPTSDMEELYAQRIRLVDDMRQSLKTELAEVRNIIEELTCARDDFNRATRKIMQIINSEKSTDNSRDYLASEP